MTASQKPDGVWLHSLWMAEPADVAREPTTNTVYVSTVNANTAGGAVKVIDGATNTVATVPTLWRRAWEWTPSRGCML